MYKIGELSKLSQIPVKTLRYYDGEGLLTPVYVDDFTGYRYYSAAQLSECYRIVMLKDLGFRLSEIKEFLSASDKDRQKLLSCKQEQLMSRKAEIENSINVLHKLSLSLKEDQRMFDIVVRESETFSVAFERRIVADRMEAQEYLKKFRSELEEEKLGERSVIIDYSTEYSESGIDVGFGVEVKGKLSGKSAYCTKDLVFDGDTVNLICNKDNFAEALEAVNQYIADHSYQIIGPEYHVFYLDDTIEIKVPVAKLGEFNPIHAESIDVPFQEDPEFFGRWEMIDCVPCKESFNPACIKTTDLSKTVKDLYFLPKGERYWCFGWTKGYLLSRCGWPEKVNRNAYTIERIGDEQYMFIEFKAYDYYLGGRPEIWVLKKIDSKEYRKEEICIKDEIPDLPAEDEKVLGTWDVCELVRHPDKFDPGNPGGVLSCEALYWRKAQFLENGVLNNIFGSISGGKTETSGAPTWRWVRDNVICVPRSTASRYLIKRIGAEDFLFIQWKSGDYTYGGEDPLWYVFRRESGE